ncbi:AraC family transcriptional regulator [Streptomyces sp. NPDC056296]|uniref:AraC family transcriptional regulator n=1 Tax=Streptomyces sp. NPDC056296 TaxID=3345775 RepID=UPI0035D9A13C
MELAGQPPCTSDDFDEYRARVNDAFYPARMELVSPGTRLSHAWMSAIRLRHLTVGVVRFGADVLVDPGDVGGYHVNVPLAGSVVSRCGSREIVATPELAAVFSPDQHTVLPSWSVDATQVCLKIERAALEEELARVLGRPVDRRLRFDLGFDLTASVGQRWWATLNVLLDTLKDPSAVAGPGHAAQLDYLERALLVGLLIGQGHSMTQALDSRAVDKNPTALGKAVDVIHSAPGSQYNITDLAHASGVGVRQLQKLFRDRFDMSPSEYLRQVRLEGTRRELLHAPTTVSDVAFRWGFNHLGRFADHYRRKFGESPSQTLRGGGSDRVF